MREREKRLIVGSAFLFGCLSRRRSPCGTGPAGPAGDVGGPVFEESRRQHAGGRDGDDRAGAFEGRSAAIPTRSCRDASPSCARGSPAVPTRPRWTRAPGTYEAAATAMVFANLDAEANRAYDRHGRQLSEGPPERQRLVGLQPREPRATRSISQYAVLGLWEAENAGVDVSPSVWDRAAEWYMSVQSGGGSWNYHRDEAHLPRNTVDDRRGGRQPDDLPAATGPLPPCQARHAARS